MEFIYEFKKKMLPGGGITVLDVSGLKKLDVR